MRSERISPRVSRWLAALTVPFGGVVVAVLAVVLDVGGGGGLGSGLYRVSLRYDEATLVTQAVASDDGKSVEFEEELSLYVLGSHTPQRYCCYYYRRQRQPSVSERRVRHGRGRETHISDACSVVAVLGACRRSFAWRSCRSRARPATPRRTPRRRRRRPSATSRTPWWREPWPTPTRSRSTAPSFASS